MINEHQDRTRCHICKREMNLVSDLTTKDCGGDCLKCMADYVLDTDCIAQMYKITGNKKYKLKLNGET